MPVMVLYKDKSVPNEVAADISKQLAAVTKDLLDAAIEVRILEPLDSFNANEIHLEMAFRDFKDWPDELLTKYHKTCMATIASCLKGHKISCAYSFYIIPSQPPRSIWEQGKV